MSSPIVGPGSLDSVRLQAPSSKRQGHTKDWVGVAYPDRLEIRYGKTEQYPNRLTKQTIPASSCEGGSPVSELLKRKSAKMSEGYEVVSMGLGSPQQGGAQSSKAAKPVAPKHPSLMDSYKPKNTWFV